MRRSWLAGLDVLAAAAAAHGEVLNGEFRFDNTSSIKGNLASPHWLPAEVGSDAQGGSASVMLSPITP